MGEWEQGMAYPLRQTSDDITHPALREYLQMKDLNKKSMIGILAFCFTCQLSNLTLGVLAYIMQSYPDVPATTVSQIATTPALVATVYAFFVGTLHKKFPAKYLILFAQVCVFLYGMVFLFCGGAVPAMVLVVAAGLMGINQGSCNTLLAIVLEDACPDAEKRGSILGICNAVMSLGGVVMVNIGAALAVDRWQNAYLTFFVVAASIVLQLLFLPKGAIKDSAPLDKQENKKSSAKLPLKAWLIAIHYFFFFLALYVFGLNVSEYVITTHQLGGSVEAGVATSMITVGGVVAGALFGVYSKYLKKFTVPVLMGLCVIGLVLPIVVTTSIMAIYICGFILGFAMMGCSPYIITYLAKVAPGEAYSKALSVYSGFMNAGMVVAVSVLAFLTQLFFGDGAYVPGKFVVGAVMAMACFITAFPIYAGKD